jgi:hypothetical protein
MTIQILKETPQHLVLHLEDGRVDTVINDNYSKLKYGTYMGNRIFYKFDNDIEIAETFNDRIFNCTYNGETIQFRDEHSNKLAGVIKEESKTAYIEFYKEIYFQKHRTELLNDLMIESYGGRVVAQNDGSFVIDNVFMINSHGQAYFISSKKSKNPQWSNLCIVVEGSLNPQVMQTKVGAVEFDTTLLTIMYKIDYLISPTVKAETGLINNTFMYQLPNWLQKQVEIGVFGKIKKDSKSRHTELGDGNQ